MRKFFGLFLIALVVFSACNNNESKNTNSASGKNVTITGQFQNANNQTIYVKNVKDGNLAVLDSITTDENGKFEVAFNLPYEDYVILVTPDQRQYIQLIVSPDEKIELTGDFSDLMNTYNVKGSENSAVMKAINDYHLKAIAQVDSLGKIYRAKAAEGKADEIKDELDAAFRKIIDGEKTYLTEVINKNPNSLTALFALYQQLGPQTPIFFPKEDLALFEKVSDSLMAVIPESELVKQLADLVEKTKNPPAQVGAIGSEAPEIALPNPDGKVIKLSSLRGKYVLLDFWAAWCRPCRMENPNVVANYKKYNKDGFTVYSVSLDQTKEAWEKAIKDDGLVWENHVSDLKYWQSEAARKYQITAIPSNFLLDKDGKIIARNLRGPALGQKLKEIFGH